MSFRVCGTNLISSTELSVSTTGTQCLDGIDNFSVQSVYTDATPAAKVFPSSGVSTGNNTLTLASHGLSTGIVGQFTTSDTLPTGISAMTDYYIIRVDANTVAIATSLDNAVAGTKVDITTQGVGDQTFTPTALAGATLKLQASNDNTNWTDIPDASYSISASGNSIINVDGAAYRYVRAVFTPGSGALSMTVSLNGVSISRS